MDNDDQVSVGRPSPDESDTPSDPIKDEIESKQCKVMWFAQTAEQYCKWVVREETIICQTIGGEHCHKVENLLPFPDNGASKPDHIWINPTEYSLSGPPDLQKFLHQVQTQVLQRFAILITRGVPHLMRSVTYSNEQILEWITCPLSEFRSEAEREAERFEAARANEAARLKVPISSIPRAKEDFMEDFIPTRLLMIGNVMQNLRAACDTYLSTSEDAWKQIELETGNAKPKHVTLTKLRRYVADVLSTDGVKQDRRSAEAVLKKFHDDALCIVVHSYRRRRQDLEMLVAQIKEWQGRWMCEQAPESDNTPSLKTNKQCQVRGPAPPVVPDSKTKKIKKPRSSTKPVTGAELRKLLVQSVISRHSPNLGDTTGKSPLEKPQSRTSTAGAEIKRPGSGERFSREKSSTSGVAPAQYKSGPERPKSFSQTTRLEIPAPKSSTAGPSVKKTGARLSSERSNTGPIDPVKRRSLEPTKSTKHEVKVDIEGKSGDNLKIAASSTMRLSNEPRLPIDDDSDNEFLVDI